MLEQLVQFIGWQIATMLNGVTIPIAAWNVLASGYAAMLGLINGMAKLPFVPWNALGQSTALILTTWLGLYLASAVVRILLLKWGSGK